MVTTCEAISHDHHYHDQFLQSSNTIEKVKL